jgi:riboflavin synthase
MFTGIIERIVPIKNLSVSDEGAVLILSSHHLPTPVNLGSSVAINGVCLTVEHINQSEVHFRLMPETLRKTSFAEALTGDIVNLETSLTPQKDLAGHFVYGHVDGVGKVIDLQQDGNAWLWRVQVPDSLTEYLVLQGAIALHGVSLTIARLEDSIVTISLVKHTLEHTNIKSLPVGAKVNIECDMLLKFAAKSLKKLSNS